MAQKTKAAVKAHKTTAVATTKPVRKPVATAEKTTAPKKPAVSPSKSVASKPATKVAAKPAVAKSNKPASPVRNATGSATAQPKVDMTSHSKKPTIVKSPAVKVQAAKPAAPKAVAGKSPNPSPAAKEPVAKPVMAKPAVKPAAPVPQQTKPAAVAAAPVRPAQPLAQQQRAVPAAVGKPAGAKITAPVVASPVAAAPVATPKQLAEKAAAARQGKPVNSRHGFKTNEFIVYPAHGVGRIVGIEEQEIAGMSLELFVITFEKEKLTLRVPTGKAESVRMRKLAEEDIVRKAMDTLKGRARVKRTMWSRRAQEYVAKINSGDLVSIAEVVRDLYRSEAQPEQSYSERQLYEDALDRMAREIAAVEKLDERGAVQRITDVLSKSARGRRIEAGEDAGDEVKAA